MTNLGPLGQIAALVCAFAGALLVLWTVGVMWLGFSVLLATLPWWAWVLAALSVIFGSYAWYRHNWVEWSDDDGYHACWRWELPDELPAAPTQFRGLAMPKNFTPHYCDQCGSRLQAGTCPMCGCPM